MARIDEGPKIPGELLPLIEDARPEQRSAIRSTKPFIVVSAGAGTGKTHTLARRFAWLLAIDPTCRVDQILTLTFTQLAAQEMRERIRKTLCEWYARNPKSLSHLRDAIERMDEAYISTIHSFAFRVIRESGLDLDIDPGASLVSDPMEREFWADYAWCLDTLSHSRVTSGLDEDWRARFMETVSRHEYGAFLNYYDGKKLSDLSRGASELHGSMNRTPEWLSNMDRKGEAISEAWRRVVADLSVHWECVWEIWQRLLFPTVIPAVNRKNKFDLRLYELSREYENPSASTREKGFFFVKLINHALKDPRGKIKDLIEETIGRKLVEWRDGYRERAALTEAILSPALCEVESLIRGMLLDLAAVGWRRWEMERKRAGVLSFSDQIRYAGSILFSNPSYSSRFRHVMIDEFQDIDSIQERFVSSMVAAWDSEGGGHGKTLFVVGDIKQSIYGFRHANPALFAEYIDRATTSDRGVHIPLSCSYRMNGAMMDGIDAVFGNLWRDGVIGGGEVPLVRYDSLKHPADEPWWTKRNGSLCPSRPLELLLHVQGDREDGGRHGFGKEDKRRIVASGVARRLRDLVESGEAVWDKSPADGTPPAFRPMSWKDVSILVPTRTSYPVLERAFEDAGIPVVFDGGRKLLARGEVRDIVNLLRLLDKPGDEYALAGWIESPFSGLEPGFAAVLVDEAILRGGPSGRVAAGSIVALFAEKCPVEAARLERLRRVARFDSPSAALFPLLEDLAWLDRYEPHLRLQVLANVHRNIDIVREYERSVDKSLSACADYLGREMREASEAEEPGFRENGRDAVRVMTIHASKGLEFPVVVLMEIDAKAKRSGSERVLPSRLFGVVSSKLPRFSPTGGLQKETFQSTTARCHSYMEEEESRREEERLLYVAMTRAKERLICCGSVRQEEETEVPYAATKERSSWLDWILAANGASGDPFPVNFIDETAVEERPVRASSESGSGMDVSVTQRKSPPSFKGDPRLARFSASAYALVSWCPMAYRMRYRQGMELKWEMPDGDGYGGADMGTLAHWVMREWDFDPETLEKYLPLALEKKDLRRVSSNVPTDLLPVFESGAVRRVVREWLEAFACTEDCAALRRLFLRGVLSKERSFRVPFAGTRLVGSIDLYWEDDEGFHIRDWKITPEESAPEALYLRQIYFYSLAASLASPENMSRRADMGLIYLRPGDSGKTPVKSNLVFDRNAIENDVATMARLCVTGPFEPMRRRCGVCPFRKTCIA